MLKKFEEVSQLIEAGKILHIAGSADVLRNLPAGNWIGGSTEHFMAQEGGVVSDSLMFVTEFEGAFVICDYGLDDIPRIAADAYNNGFSIVIIPFGCEVHKEYAKNAAGYEQMFIKNIVGWISGANPDKPGQAAIAVNGLTGQVLADRAAVLHLEVSEPKTVSVGIVNIHSPDGDSPVIEFDQNGSSTVTTCRVDGKEMLLAEYLREKNHNSNIPMVGNYFGQGVNVAFRAFDGDKVHLFAPVFAGIKYRFAKNVPDYSDAFHEKLSQLKDTPILFSCNCILNFLHGDLEGKNFGAHGPVTFGEVAYQLLTQTLVYVTVV